MVIRPLESPQQKKIQRDQTSILNGLRNAHIPDMEQFTSAALHPLPKPTQRNCQPQTAFG